jgi:hypothetical protein
MRNNHRGTAPRSVIGTRQAKSKAKGNLFVWKPAELSAREKLERDCVTFMAEMAREELDVGRGVKESQDTASIIRRHAHLFTASKLKAAKDHVRLTERWPAKTPVECASRLYWFIVFGTIDRKLAKISDQLATARASGRVAIGSRKVAWFDTTPLLAKATSAATRETVWKARLAFIERELNPILTAINVETVQSMRRLGFRGYRDLAEKSMDIDLGKVSTAACQVAAATERQYLKSMGEFVRGRLGLKFPGLSRAHHNYIVSAAEFDRLFPKGKVAAACRRTFEGLGLDFNSRDGLRVDLDDRPGKDARAFCLAINPPHEVWLVVKPHGGSDDCASFLHEGGHFWHYAETDRRLPMEMRWLGRSSALTETYAYLFETLLQDERWLMEVAGLDRKEAEAVAGRYLLADAYQFRRFVGKLLYELKFDEQPLDNWTNRFFYRTSILRLTGLDPDEEPYLEDTDEWFYCADYLRSWLAEPVLRARLKRDFGEAWYANRDAGQFLKALFAKGDSWDCEDLVDYLGAEPLDPGPLISRFSRLSEGPR